MLKQWSMLTFVAAAQRTSIPEYPATACIGETRLVLVQGLLQWRHVVLGDRAELAPHSHLGWTDIVCGVASILLWIVRFGNPTAALGQHTPRLGQPTFEFNFLALSHSPLQKSGRTYP